MVDADAVEAEPKYFQDSIFKDILQTQEGAHVQRLIVALSKKYTRVLYMQDIRSKPKLRDLYFFNGTLVGPDFMTSQPTRSADQMQTNDFKFGDLQKEFVEVKTSNPNYKLVTFQSGYLGEEWW